MRAERLGGHLRWTALSHRENVVDKLVSRLSDPVLAIDDVTIFTIIILVSVDVSCLFLVLLLFPFAVERAVLYSLTLNKEFPLDHITKLQTCRVACSWAKRASQEKRWTCCIGCSWDVVQLYHSVCFVLL